MPTLYTTQNYTKIWYHTPYASAHTHQIPIKNVTTAGLGDAGTLVNWNGTPIPADTMIKTLMDKLGEVVLSSTVYDKFVIYAWNPAEQLYNPVYEEAYSVVGTGTGITGQAKANQNTISFRTLGFHLLKLVLLDRPNNGFYGNQNPVPADYTEVVAEIVSEDNGWAGRDNTRPAVATNVSISLNKRLRRKYGMV